MTIPKSGPLTADELIELWKSVTEPSYHEPILNDPTSLSLIGQLAEQLARASTSIDRNTQAMFIRRWSGQTNPEAAGETIATVDLQFERTKLLDRPLTLFAGMVVEAVLTDYSKEGPITVSTKRKYIISQDVTFAPGQRGPFIVPTAAEKAGPGYNLPPPGTITSIQQAGAGLLNNGASVLTGTGNSHELRAGVLPDVPTVSNIGAYMLMTEGANVGQVRRIIGFGNPIPGTSGGSSILAADGVFTVSAVTGDFQQGETVEQAVSGAIGTVLTVANGYAVIQRNSGTFVAGQPILGALSSATLLIDSVTIDPAMAAETATAGWQVLSLADDFGLTATNLEFPSGGFTGFLDELGEERDVQRSTAESDEDYRLRVIDPGDVVSPNALRRAGNRILKQFCLEVCLREVGRREFPGIFYDDEYAIPNFFDLFQSAMTWTNAGVGFLDGEKVHQIGADGVITSGTIQKDYPVSAPGPLAPGLTGQPLAAPVAVGVERVQGPGFVAGLPLKGLTSGYEDNVLTVVDGFDSKYLWVVVLDLREFRGFFAIGVPNLTVFESEGFSYDQAVANAYDATDIETNFYDTDIEQTSTIYAQIRDAIDNARAAGVPWIMYLEEHGCASP